MINLLPKEFEAEVAQAVESSRSLWPRVRVSQYRDLGLLLEHHIFKRCTALLTLEGRSGEDFLSLESRVSPVASSGSTAAARSSSRATLDVCDAVDHLMLVLGHLRVHFKKAPCDFCESRLNTKPCEVCANERFRTSLHSRYKRGQSTDPS